MKHLYLEQQHVPMDSMSDEQLKATREQRAAWPMQYRVVKVKQSITPKVGEVLNAAEAHVYCENPDWVVEIN